MLAPWKETLFLSSKDICHPNTLEKIGQTKAGIACGETPWRIVSCMDVRVGLYRKLSAKEWSFWIVVLKKTLESPLDSKEYQPVHPKGKQSWIFIGRTDVEAETPILWPPDVKNWLTAKDPDAWKCWRQEEKGTTEDEMVGWHHRLNGHEFG